MPRNYRTPACHRAKLAQAIGLGLAVGGFIGGPLLESLGGHALFLIFGVVVLIVVAGVALLQKHWHVA